VTCSIDGCDREHYAKGWCYTHYARARRNNGDPQANKPIRDGNGHAHPEVATQRTRVTPWRYV
jgi:hypothetical protein